MISDPNTVDHALSYARAQKRAAEHMLVFGQSKVPVNMDCHIGEDEFANDPEVQNCLLAPEDVAKKEQVWVNTNKDWLRQQQIKAYKKKLEERGPPKARRNRKKKPRIGEGQVTPAASPGEAAVGVLKARAFSKKINYDAIRGMFDDLTPTSALGSTDTSRVVSRAGSESVTGSTPSASVTESAPPTPAAIAESEMGDSVELNEDDIEDTEGDYVVPEPETPRVQNEPVQEEEPEDWRKGFIRQNSDDEDGFPEDDEDDYMGEGFEEPDFDAEIGAFDGPEDDDY
ncbi:hypothetical protein G7Y89_g15045 [Cudoniella acicularis]|uniref:Brf1 TBP-binding domain-containing protein n=1 Tax=Cudoniella acicularis TaxID=354080 RepID=A0A8H4QTK1_9HELO|nr:hypothetical protein G7Y89_g15045 [Cudoniella acicularis]